jgi:hypothetical protein
VGPTEERHAIDLVNPHRATTDIFGPCSTAGKA